MSAKGKKNCVSGMLRKQKELKRKYSIAKKMDGGSSAEQKANPTAHRMQSLCWDCARAYGFCRWSSCGEPVEGWDAEETEYEGIKYTTSYIVYGCPEFEKEERRKSQYPILSERDLPLLEDIHKKRMYCETDDVYFKTILECAKYIESKGDYNEDRNVYWVLTSRREKGFKTITIGSRVYRFLFPEYEDLEVDV